MRGVGETRTRHLGLAAVTKSDIGTSFRFLEAKNCDMATRPIFVPQKEGHALCREVSVDFEWHPGFAPSQESEKYRRASSGGRWPKV